MTSIPTPNKRNHQGWGVAICGGSGRRVTANQFALARQASVDIADVNGDHTKAEIMHINAIKAVFQHESF